MWWIPILRASIGLLMRTLRVRSRGCEALDALVRSRAPFVLVFWHGSMLYPWWRMRGANAASLVSRSRDGDILAGVLRGWGYDAIRGSSSRGGGEAMEAMRSMLRSGRILCVTPDGPRGPARTMKMGAVRAAQTTGVPLVAMTVGYARKKVLRSWDRFEIPAPFTRAVVLCDLPVTIDRALVGDALDALRADVEARMTALHLEAVRTATEGGVR